MSARKSSRGAAVVLAGCVGLAVLAPGLALADTSSAPPTSNADCVAQSPTKPYYDAAQRVCVADDPSAADTSSPSSTTTTTTTTTPPPANVGPAGGAQPEGPNGEVAGTPSTGGGSDAPSPLRASLVRPQLDAAIDEVTPGDLLELPDIPGLPDLPVNIPQPDADGNFENVNDACLNAISQLQFPVGTEGLPDLSEQLQGFCAQLDPTTLTDLVDQLRDLLKGLIPTLHGNGGTIPRTPPATVPAVYAPYWSHQYDVDCGDVTYEEANALLAADPSDPFRLDGDHDGEACEDNGHGTSAEAEYIGYPVGGVSTGDGSTGTMDASPAALALAGAGVGGLALAGLTLVRRFGRES